VKYRFLPTPSTGPLPQTGPVAGRAGARPGLVETDADAAVALSLLLVYPFSRGITSPLRMREARPISQT